MQLPCDSQSILHAPPEQSTSHGTLPPQLPSHCPGEQLQFPFVQSSDERALPTGRGSGNAGSELHATVIRRTTRRDEGIR